MKKLTTKTIIYISALLVLLIGTMAYLYYARIKADTAETVSVVSGDDVKKSDQPAIPTADTRAEVSVPILMYHHIRNYSDPNDQIGTNLSVSPENFKSQIDYLKQSGYTTISFQDLLDFPQKKLPEKPIILTFDDGYNDAFDAYKILKGGDQIGVFYIISNYFGRAEHLSESQVKEMSDAGMEIGSHTANHPDLTTISISQVNSELTSSKTTLEAIIGKPVISFCYPAGKHDDISGKAVRDAKYLTATTTKSAISSTSEEKILLSRIRINPSDTATSLAKKITN